MKQVNQAGKPQSKETRAIQHLLIQGFEVLPCYAAVATLLTDRSPIEEAGKAWAVVCDKKSLAWLNRLPDSEPFKTVLVDCATKAEASGQQHVMCCVQGVCLVTDLDADNSDVVVTARSRIEGAIQQSKTPPTERLEAFGDEAIEAEFERRKRKTDKLLKAQR